ncbi:hypothetical protein pb186bvf_006502 [Paramecium bursaria]
MLRIEQKKAVSYHIFSNKLIEINYYVLLLNNLYQLKLEIRRSYLYNQTKQNNIQL